MDVITIILCFSLDLISIIFSFSKHSLFQHGFDLYHSLFQHGFDFNHAQPGYVLMTKWLPDNEENKLPEYANQFLGMARFSFVQLLTMYYL